MGAGPGLHFTSIEMYGTHAQWADMPAAATEFLAIPCRKRIRTEGYAQAMSSVEVIGAGAAGAVLRSEYTLDLTGASGWAALVGENMSIAASGVVVTNWVTLPTAAKDREVLVRIMGESGDGVADPSVARIWIGLR